jgi:hypothetical protein
VDLTAEKVVAVGSVFNRQTDPSISWLLKRLHVRGIKVHALGFKKPGLKRSGRYLASADSMAWSFEARMLPEKNRCRDDATHRVCNNCYEYAWKWLNQLHEEVTLEGIGTALRRDGLDSPNAGHD